MKPEEYRPMPQDSHRQLTPEERKQLRHQAHEQMIADYHWLLSEPPKKRQWRCSRRWLVELVHDVREHQPLLDDLHRPQQLSGLYQEFFSHIGTPMPQHPANQLHKLRLSEMRQGISPDSITLYYMNRLREGTKLIPGRPIRRIIEQLMEPE